MKLIYQCKPLMLRPIEYRMVLNLPTFCLQQQGNISYWVYFRVIFHNVFFSRGQPVIWDIGMILQTKIPFMNAHNLRFPSLFYQFDNWFSFEILHIIVSSMACKKPIKIVNIEFQLLHYAQIVFCKNWQSSFSMEKQQFFEWQHR